MASIVVNRGLQVIGGRASNTADAFAAIQCTSVDDSVTAFLAADSSLGSPTTTFDKNFDATPTRAGQVITHTTTLATGEGNMTIRRVALHNATSASVTGSTTTLVAGVDGLNVVKTSSFSLVVTITLTYTSV